MRVFTPITGDVLSEVSPTPLDAVHDVFDRARAAQREWASRPSSERGHVLRAVAELMDEHADEIADLETSNTGKPLVDTRREAARAAGTFRYYAGWCDKTFGTTIPVGNDFHTYTRREPRGVVVGIIPWNVPYFFAAKKIAPALAFGNACVLKPAPETPLTALRLAELLTEAGVPDGLAQVVVGGGEIGQALIDEGQADLVALTGSHETGRVVARAAARHLIPTVLELGGKSPQLVFSDADLDAALESVLLGIFGACGQMCIAGSRLFVQAPVYDEFVDRLRDRVRSIRVGDPRHDGVHVGPQVTARQRDKTLHALEQGERQGGRVLAQARLPQDETLRGGFFAPPTLFDRVDVDADLMQEEIFGPVLAVAPFEHEQDALRLAHRTRFGLAAGVWTSDLGRAHRLARELDVGTVWINTYRVLNDLVPFGGNGWSGHGRENAEEAMRLYTRVKSVWTAETPGLPAGYRL